MKIPKSYLNKFVVITEECTAIVQSALTVGPKQLIKGENGVSDRYFVPFRAFDGNRMEELKEMIDSQEGDSIDIEDLYPFMLVGTLWADKVNSAFDLPVKGENVTAVFNYTELDLLQCTNLITIAKVKPMKFNMARLKFEEYE